MTTDRPILVVAATARELAPAGDGWRTLRCGVGPVEAAAATAFAIAERRPAAVLNVGIAGARRHRAVAPLTVVVGTEARYCDLPASMPPAWAPHVIEPPLALVTAVKRVVPAALALPIGTSARVGGTSGCDIEAMEGFGVLRSAQLAGVPAVEVRVVSNDVEQQDRRQWRLDEAFDLVAALTPRLVAELRTCLS